MPEDIVTTDLQIILGLLEDDTLDKPTARSQYYKQFQNALDSGIHLTASMIDRLLAICVHDLQDNKKFCMNILNIINSILNKFETGEFSAVDIKNLVPSFLGVLSIIKTISFMAKVDTLISLSFKTVLSYPDSVFIEVVTEYSTELTDLLNVYYNLKVPMEIKHLPCELICKLIRTLPQDKKIKFVKENLTIWFSKFIPTIFVPTESVSLKPLEALELLTDELVSIDYADDPNWLQILECIYNPQKYPCVMKTLLESGSKTWHRLWIVCIRLLKNQITKSNNPIGSPINSMLPVVELAFKLDIKNRCRAFQCWDVLIDNFHMETNEVYVVKRLKLLIIPLKSNNAKVEETALAKLNTWWHLIYRFQNRLDKFVDMVLISFLHFCFGKHATSQKPVFSPGLLTSNTKKQAVNAFIQLSGHLCCGGCVNNIPQLNCRLLTKKILVDYWNDWVYSLKMAITISNDNADLTMQQVSCMWKSFAVVISELPDNNIRKDLFNELLMVLENLLQDSDSNSKFAEIVINLIWALFEEEKIRVLLKTKGESQGPMHKIISIVMKPSFNIYYRRYETKDIVLKLKPLTNVVVDDSVCSSGCIIKWMFCDANLPQDNISILWTAIAESLYNLKSNVDCVCPLLWPLKSNNFFVDVKYSTLVWYRLLGKTNSKLIQETYPEIRAFLKSIVTPSNILLKLYATLGLLNHSVAKLIDPQHKLVELLCELLNRVTDYKCLDDVFSILIDTLVHLLKSVSIKDIVAKNSISCVKVLFKLITPVFEQILAKERDIEKVETILKYVDILFQNKKSSSLSITIANELVEFGYILKLKNHHLKKSVLSLMKTCLLSIKDDKNNIYKKIKSAIDVIESCEKDTNELTGQCSDGDKFTTPDLKAIVKKAKKKEASIENTVVENGEEFIVVKSNWKFNPRKLTENQKEKFQRKREDIPALYQDLSQSQDEFKLKTWKTDSQDSSSTSSKSTTVSKTGNAEDVSNILKNIPSSDVVPKIIENIFFDNVKKDDISDIKSIDEYTAKVKQTSTPKDAKSPRMALKDRVFRNVRNLIEKSNIQKDNKDLSESLIQIENIPKTPSSKALDCNNLVNSAPPKISTERPSRVKRKPKKFDDAELFALKRGRRSLSQGDSQLESDMVCETSPEAKKEEPTEEIVTETAMNTKTKSNKDADLTEIGVEEIKVIETSNITENVPATVDNKLNDSPQQFCDAVSDKNIADDVNEEPIPVGNVPNVLPEKVSVSEKKEIDSKPEPSNQENTDNNESSSDKSVKTPRTRKRQETNSEKSSVKRGSVKKSRIEKELAIDMVEGHPFLKIQTEKRVTRKNLSIPLNTSRRKSLTEKLNKSKSDPNKSTSKVLTPNVKKRDKERPSAENDVMLVSIGESQDKTITETADDFPLSEDVIESSQESTFTTISLTSNKNNLKKLSVMVEKVITPPSISDAKIQSQSLLDNERLGLMVASKSVGNDSKEDIELSRNKTVCDKTEMDATENMDTEPMDKLSDSKDTSSDVIIINDDEEPIVINNDDTCVGTETQEIAEADTLPTDPNDFIKEECKKPSKVNTNKIVLNKAREDSKVDKTLLDNIIDVNTEDDTTKTMSESIDLTSKTDEDKTASSPFKDEEQRKKDFLDNTLEISPIKTMSPVREKKSPSPETSSDYVVIKLSSPVQSNGEPFEKMTSPEIFTEEKVSPDKRDMSPPREESTANNNSSPSSSLSLKKNRPQVRSGGRAAQMLGLCVPDRLQTLMNSERSEQEEPKKSSPSSTPARRNLRILYNSVGDSSENSEENEDSENFLRFKKSLPMSDCSPSGPILKRKLAEITDEATVSPASKRKRVSFHDPPVSTTISVQKYIEPGGIRSPQNSAIKRQERQILRSQATLKSPKRLDNVFKLESVLTKTVESFTEVDRTSTDDTQSMSLDETPAVEIVKNSDLNDTDPICLELTDCNDPIDNIAAELSSPTMKAVFLKELEGKISTIGDLAKMTELEVNRLCIKAPKVKVTKKVLTDYATKRVPDPEVPKIFFEDVTNVKESLSKMDIETQTTGVVLKHFEMQTVPLPVAVVSVQTDKMSTLHTSAQTNESGCKSTKESITTCLAEKPDFVEQLGCILEDTYKEDIAEKLPFDSLTNIIMTKATTSNSYTLITRILEKHNNSSTMNGQLSFLQEYLCDKFDNRDLILFCSQLLAKIHKKPF